MSVYILAQLRFTDLPSYRRYQAALPAVFDKFQGKVLAADEAPVSLEGALNQDKVVILEFPDESEALRFAKSPEYRAISVDRHKGAESIFALIKGI
jgi:uncharacterized protein (DUF1330 family)